MAPHEELEDYDENQNEVKEEEKEKSVILMPKDSIQIHNERMRRRTFGEWFKKYFLQGQSLENQQDDLYFPSSPQQESNPLDELRERKRRKMIAIVVPLVVSQFLWWIAALKYDYLSLYKDYWQMPSAMIVGSTIAGMTSEAGGAVAFPVMTFALKTSPTDGRDFSLLIQSFGMGLATCTIVYNKIRVDWHAISFAVLGSLPGVMIGFQYVDPNLTASQKKMIFVSVWTSFAIALWILNREKKRKTVPCILEFCKWKACILLFTGFIGGIFTAFAGSGVDICLFSIVTLLFSLTEKTATPTTIVSMALTSWFALYWRIMIVGEISPLVVNYIKCSIPVCTIMAPIGSFLGSHFHRQVLAHLVYICEFLAMLGFLFTRPSWTLILPSLGILFIAFLFFTWLSRQGRRLLLQTLADLQTKGELRRISVAEMD